MRTQKLWLFIALLLLAMSVPAEARDQDAPPADPDNPKTEPRGSIVIAPIPVSSPAIGSGLVLVAGYVFKVKADDTVSPPSFVGTVGAYTNNGSRGALLGGRLYLNENKYQTTFAGGKGRVNYDFFGIGRFPGRPAVPVALQTGGNVFLGEFLRHEVWRGKRLRPRTKLQGPVVRLSIPRRASRARNRSSPSPTDNWDRTGPPDDSKQNPTSPEMDVLSYGILVCCLTVDALI